jgi:acyl carrier protein
LAYVRITLQLQKKVNKKLDISEMTNFKKIKDLYEYVTKDK